jgi:RNA-directed DNA polymerase
MKSYHQARTNTLKKWVVDADIRGAFDNISHDFLLNAIGPVPGRELIRQWLKAGIIEEESFQPTESGTPQGGVISPLLLNIALHGIEEALGITYSAKGTRQGNRAVVRYADDFVVFCEDQEDAEACQHILSEWLAERGLTLSEEKTRIVHLSEGFDFLGFNIRHYRTPKTTRSGWKLLIKPSKKSVETLKGRLRTEWMRLRGHSPAAVIRLFNPIIRGWANYFRIGVSKETFVRLDYWMTYRAIRYAKRRHPRKTKRWWRPRYFGRFHPERQDRWVFGDRQTGAYLLKLGWFPIQRHSMVKGRASPDDPDLRDYWLQREQRKTRTLIPSRKKLADRQRGRCPCCGESLFNGEAIEAHHVVARKDGGSDAYSNLQLVHLFCHQQLTATA